MITCSNRSICVCLHSGILLRRIVLILSCSLLLTGEVRAEVKSSNWTPELLRIANVDPVIKKAIELILIPSPPGNESRVADQIVRELTRLGIVSRLDAHRNVLGAIPASPGYEQVPSLLLIAHMDIVPGDKRNPNKQIKPRLKEIDGREWLTSDGTTTLGADDKAGVAAILDVIAMLTGKHPRKKTPINHGPIEVALTVEEETTGRGVIGLDATKLKSKYVLVIDGFRLYEIIWRLASTTEVTIKIHGARGGHSGEEIDRPDNINAIKVMSEVDSLIPQGVIRHDKDQVITSINAGIASGGTAANVIAPEAQLEYLIRSTDPATETILLDGIRTNLMKVQTKYQEVQSEFRIDMEISKSLPAWSANPESSILKLAQKSAEQTSGQKVDPISVHAGSDTSIIGTNKRNSAGEAMEPILIGIANIQGAHSTRERLDWRSLLTGRDWLLKTITLLTENVQSQTK